MIPFSEKGMCWRRPDLVAINGSQIDDSGSVLAMSKCSLHVQVERLSSC